MKYTQKPISIFPNNIPSHFVVISHDVAMLSLSCSWHGHVVVSDTWFSSAHHIVTHISISLFHIGSFLCFQSYQFAIYQLIICYENELPSSTREIAESYLLHEAELPPSPLKL